MNDHFKSWLLEQQEPAHLWNQALRFFEGLETRIPPLVNADPVEDEESGLLGVHACWNTHAGCFTVTILENGLLYWYHGKPYARGTGNEAPVSELPKEALELLQEVLA